MLDQLNLFKQYIGNLTRIVGEEGVMNIMNNSVSLVCASTNDLIISLPARSLQYDVDTYDRMLFNLTLNFIKVLTPLLFIPSNYIIFTHSNIAMQDGNEQVDVYQLC